MNNPQQLITDNLNIWTAAIKKRGSQGRGSSKKIELHGIKKLRELILELAVRGLLVPQNPNDDPASVLLEKIAAEKEQLIKDGKIKKQKALPEISDEEKPFELPKGWEWAKLGSLVEMYNGRAFKSSEWVTSGIPIVRIQNLNSNDAEFNYFDGELADHNRIDNDSFLISWSGTPGTSFGAFIWGRGEAALNQHINNCIFHYGKMNLNFMRLAVNGCMNHFISMAQGAVGLKHVTKGTLNNAVMGFPPEAEQPRIVAKVDELMALCDKLEQQTEDSLTAHKTLVETLLNSLLDAAQTYPGHASDVSRDIDGDLKDGGSSQKDKTNSDPFQQAWQRIWDNFDTLFTTEHSIDQLKQTILQLAVMGKLVPQDPNDEPASVLLEKIAAEKERLIKDGKIKKQKPLPEITDEEKPFDLPKGWEWVRLPDVGDLARGKSKHRPRNDPALYVDGNIPLVQTGDVSRANGIIETYTALYNKLGLEQSRLWPKGTMCITIAANIADTSVLGFDACFPDSVVGYTPYDKGIDVKYFEYFIRTAKSDLEKYAPSTAQKNINLEILGQVLVPLPPKIEISSIVSKVGELMALCDTLKERIRESQATQLHLADAMAEQAL